jgi:hypothetical protein
MHIRRAVLIGGLLCSSAALCGEESKSEIIASSVSISSPELIASSVSISSKGSELLCSICTVKLVPNSATRFEANQITVNRETGVLYLSGAVRVTFKSGGELRSEDVAVKTDSNGGQELSGDEFRILEPESL